MVRARLIPLISIWILPLFACSSAPQVQPSSPNARPAPPAAQHRVLLHPKDFSFESFDENGDDIVSQNEFRTRMTSRFAFLDTNRNGLVDVVPECGEWAWCASADANQNGQISLGEFLEAASQEYYRFNKDGEDGLSREEFSRLVKGMKFAGG